MSRLGDLLVDIKPGFASRDNLDAGVFQFRMHNFTRDSALDLSKRRRVNATHKQLQSQSVAAGDVLFNSTNSPELVGKSALIGNLDEPAVFSNHFLRLRTDSDRLYPAYLAHFLRWQFSRGVFRAMAKAWVNQATVGRDRLEDLELPLPPLPEQRRIAAILDHADALRAKRRQVLAHLDAVTDSNFARMFARESYPVVALGDIAHVKGGKRLPKGAPYAEGPTDHPYIRVTDLRNGVIETSDLRFLTPEVQQKIARYTVAEGDVVISIAGSIGLAAAVPPTLTGANLTENAAKIVPKVPQVYSGAWLARALQTRSLQDQIAGKVGRVTIGKLALFRIEQLDLSLPPLALQEQFVKQAAKVDSLRSAVQRTAAAEDSLFASLQSRAFRGEL